MSNPTSSESLTDTQDKAIRLAVQTQLAAKLKNLYDITKEKKSDADIKKEAEALLSSKVVTGTTYQQFATNLNEKLNNWMSNKRGQDEKFANEPRLRWTMNGEIGKETIYDVATLKAIVRKVMSCINNNTVRTGGAVKVAGSSKSEGGAITRRVESEDYIPKVPYISVDPKVETKDCGYKTKFVQDKELPQFGVFCKRTSVPGVQQCETKSLPPGKQTVVGVTCKNTSTQVLDGVHVDKVIYRDDETNQEVVTQVVRPVTSTIHSSHTKVERDTNIPYQPLTLKDANRNVIKTESKIPGNSFTFLQKPSAGSSSSKKVVQSKLNLKKGGSSESPVGGAVNQGGAVSISRINGQSVAVLPGQDEVRRMNFKMNERDVEEALLPEHTIPLPKKVKDLQDAQKDPLTWYRAELDGYGVSKALSRRSGFDFSFRYLPHEYCYGAGLEDAKAYLEWLVSVQYKLRAEFPDFMLSTYDIVVDTIATLETSILVCFGRMELKNQYFDRMKILEGARRFEKLMNKYLAYYALKEKAFTWVSPLNPRYKDLDSTPEKNYPKEDETIRLLNELNDALSSAANGEDSPVSDIKRIEKQIDGQTVYVSLDVAYRQSNQFPKNDSNKFDDSKVMAVVEDNFLSFLARLQFRAGYAFNTNNPTVNILMDRDHSRFLSRVDTIRYFETFYALQDEDEQNSSFIRLTEIRKQQAKQNGFSLQSANMPQGKWQPITETKKWPLPPSSVNPPTITITAPPLLSSSTFQF